MWTVLDDAEKDVIAPDFAAALDAVPGARAAWDSFPRGVRKLGLTAIAMARDAGCAHREDRCGCRERHPPVLDP